jgi:hypothetical protein
MWKAKLAEAKKAKGEYGAEESYGRV